MLDLPKPVYLHEGVRHRLSGRQIWICEWHSFVHAKPDQSGVFFVEAGHVNETMQTAKKVLRDELVLCLAFNFNARLPDADELAQIAAAGPAVVIRVPKQGARQLRPVENFAGGRPAGPTTKT